MLKEWFDKFIPVPSKGYRMLVIRAYADVLPGMLGPGLPRMVKGLYHGARGRREEKIQQFLDGSAIWGERVCRFTRTRVVRFGEIDVPRAGHLILVNHVNELDFPFDSMVLRQPYLANQTIKQTLFAYWWMKAMGSQVFNQHQGRSIAESVRALVAGLESRSYIVYPEGNNTYGEEVQGLRKGMLKLAFENRIPVYVVLKSGIASFQTRQRDNTVGYTALGTVDPRQFPTWTAFRDHVHARMVEEKKKLDALVAAS